MGIENIQVVVEQTPALISCNYEEIRQQLMAQMEVYKGMEYTDETIKDAKADRAALNKLAKELDERRKEVKREYNKPLDLFESQVKELIAIINEPVGLIDSKVKDYENRVREEKKAIIQEYWMEKAVQLPEELRDRVWNHLYDSRWENATTSAKTYKDAIDNGIADILKGIETIKSMGSEFEEEGLRAYYASFVLPDAIATISRLNAQKEAILQREREKMEREAREKAEAELRAKVEAEARARAEMQREEMAASTEKQDNSTVESENVDNVDSSVDNFKVESENVDKSTSYYSIRVPANDDMLQQIEEYLKFAEIPYEVVK